MRTGFLLAGVGVALIIILGIQFWPRSDEVAEDQVMPQDEMSTPAESLPVQNMTNQAPVVESVDARTAGAFPEPTLPLLSESDAWVRESLGEWSLPAEWLAREELIARLSVVLQNAAQGQLPRRQLSFMAPSDVFPVVKEGEVIFADPAGYARYTPYLDLLEKMPPARAAQLLNQMEPLLMEAFALLGERTSLQNSLQAAASQIEALPELDAPVLLVQPNVMYLYADPELESRSELDKQLLRMGPDNVRRFKAYVAEFMTFYSAQTN